MNVISSDIDYIVNKSEKCSLLVAIVVDVVVVVGE